VPTRILVVNDEPSVLTVVSQALREEGHEVIAVSNGETAYDVLVGETIDAVVTNACVSGVTGADLVRARRKCIPGIPVLHLDDYAKAIPPQFLVPAEVPTLFFKPFDLVALKAALRRLLRLPRPSRPRLVTASQTAGIPPGE